jgi:hypothetical protein
MSKQGTKLVERYLQEARNWLPPAQRHDILAELEEDIRSQIEDREKELGRTLEESELVEILRKRGHPIEVASRFSPRRHLIGPMFFSIYSFVLKLVVLWVIPAAFVFIVAPIIWVADPSPGRALVSLVFRMLMAMFMAFGVITGIFALLERQKLPGYAFDPTKLPQLAAGLGGGHGGVTLHCGHHAFFGSLLVGGVALSDLVPAVVPH